MTSVKQQYAELLALTRLFLQQEHAPNERLFADAECYRYFRDYAMQKAAAQPQHGAAASAPPTRPAPASQAVSAQRPMTAPAPVPASPLPAPTAAATSAPPVTQPVASGPKAAPPPLPVSIAQPATPIAAISAAPQPPKTTASPAPSPSPAAATPPAPPPAAAAAAIFVPDVPPPATPSDLKELRDLVQVHLPGVPLLATPPNDIAAKQAARLWEREHAIPAVAILCFEEQPKQRAFLENIGRALEVYGLSASVINATKMEQEQTWPRLLESPQARLVIAGGYGIYAMPSLMQHYREGEKSSGPRLGRLPLLLLSDTALYLKEPHLKPSLWKSLQELLRKSA